MEPRQLLSAAPIQVGAVYFEEATSQDEAGDLIEITWSGGSPGTKLSELVIETDKLGDGLTIGDVLFDTASGGRGTYGSFPLAIVGRDGIDSVSATLVDGGTTLRIEFVGFDPGEKLVLSVDVDEQGFLDASAVAEGNEFEGSQLAATFVAPHFYEATGSDIFLDYYDGNLSASGLDLPPDNYMPPSDIPRPVHTAGAIFSLDQTPLPISISGTVFEDRDLDNRQDAGEPGLAGVELALYRWTGTAYVASGETATTDLGGDYRFDGLLPGTYKVVESQPEGYLSVGARAGTVEGEVRGVVQTPDVIAQIELLGGEDSVGNDFAEARPVSLSGHVYHDADNDGAMDPGEEGIAGVLVRVPDRTLAPGVKPSPGAIEVYTDQDGYWQVTGLYPGEYWVEEVQPAAYLDGLDAAGTAGGTAHNPGDRIDGFQLSGGQSGQQYNFGELLPSSISGRVIADANGNCVYDPGETLLAGVTLYLLDASGARVASTSTDAQGEYAFTGLAPGVYGVEEIQPDAYYDGSDHVGSAGGKLAPPDSIVAVTLVSGTAAVRYDFCELRPASIAGRVHAELTGNCTPDPGEPLLAGVTIYLLDASGQRVASTTTDENGEYIFENLKPGTYGVEEIQPAGYYDGPDHVGSAGGMLDGNDRIAGAKLASGTEAVDYNFCELLPASISGQVHAELDGDCVPDPGEPLLAGVTIYLLDQSGDRIASTTTDEDGRYIFENLEPGTYGVEEVQPAGYFDGKDHVGSAGGMLDGNDRIIGAKLVSGTKAVDYDFCEVVPATISGYVFKDGPTLQVPPLTDPPEPSTVRDGVFTPDDTPIAGVMLRLGDATGQPILDALGRPRTAVTDARGYYEFTDLEPGSYTVFEVQPGGYLDGIDTPGSLGGTAVNPGQPVDPIALERLTVDPNDDAILGIQVRPGDVATSYNFSEVVIQRQPFILPSPPIPPVTPTPTPQPVPPPLNPWVGGLRYIPSPDLSLLPMYGGDAEPLVAYTWHLSVVNGGTPRSNSAERDTASARDSLEFSIASWSESEKEMNRGRWTLADDQGRPALEFLFGMEGGVPLTGDFDGDGTTEVAVFLEGLWYIDLNGNGVWDEGDLWARLGKEGDLPVVGDWDGDGKTDIGIFGPAWPGDSRAIAAEPGLPDSDNDLTGRQKNVPPDPDEATAGWRTMRLTSQGSLRTDVIDHVFQYGRAGDVPMAGDWNGDGVTNIGLFRGGTWYLDADGNGEWSAGDVYVEHFGEPGDLPVVGDWDGDGVDDLGLYREGLWRLDTDGDRVPSLHDKVFELGTAEDKPAAGDFNGDGVDEPAVYRDAPAPPQGQAQAAEAPAAKVAAKP